MTESESLSHYGPHSASSTKTNREPQYEQAFPYNEWSCAVVIIAGMMFITDLIAILA